MPDDNETFTIITMEDMAAVFAVTDDFAIHRESVSVELAREDPGKINITADGKVEITLPASVSPQDYGDTIRAELESRGYAHNPGQVVSNEGESEGDDEEDDDWLS